MSEIAPTAAKVPSLQFKNILGVQNESVFKAGSGMADNCTSMIMQSVIKGIGCVLGPLIYIEILQ